MKELYESMRSGISDFDKDFSDFIITRRQDDWDVKKCTLFRDDQKMKQWAFCTFEHR